MKKIFYLLVVVLIFSTFFDGRKSRETSREVVVNKYFEKNLISAVSIYPKSYTEVVTDTIIGQRFTANIKNYTLMSSKDLVKTGIPKKLYRKFQSDISINLNNKNILQLKLDADNFSFRDNQAFWTNATLEHTWVDQENSTDNNLAINISFMDPISKSYKLYQMNVNIDGEHHIQLMEEKLI